MDILEKDHYFRKILQFQALEMPSVDFNEVPYFPPDAIFDLTKQYVADPFPQKVNLGQGTYRDNNGQPWVLPSVQETKKLLENENHEYLPILGLPSFRKHATELVLGKSSTALQEERVS